jgi:hypothetical protein
MLLFEADIDAEVEYLPRRKKTASEREAKEKGTDLGFFLWSLNNHSVSEERDLNYRKERGRHRCRQLSWV